MPDFIPIRDSAFDDWFRNFCQYISQKTDASKPEWSFIPAEEVRVLSAAYSDWYSAYALCLKPHTKVQTTAKNMARRAAEKVIRRFKHRYIDYHEEISEADFKAMELKIRGSGSVNQLSPDVRPDIVLENTRNRFEHKLRALNPLIGRFRKPSGTDGISYACQIGGERPLSGADIGNSQFSRRSYYYFTYSEADKGKQVYYSLCYQNSKGDKGPWSLVVEAFIG